MKLDIIFGGKAGQGPNILSEVVSEGLIESGFYVFYSRDYESLIRGGHNFNQLTFSDKIVHSNSSKIDILVCLDENTEKIHSKNLKKGAIVLSGEHGNMFFAGEVYKILCLDFKILENQLKKLKNFEENLREAKRGYEDYKKNLNIKCPVKKHASFKFMNGSQAIAVSAVNSGLDYYYSYPMTPATPVMMELGQMSLDKKNKHKLIELESEIAVINAALGSSIVGSLVMAGTSGGGFDLMTEALSMAGQAEIPIVIYNSSRAGASTGLATYTGQEDVNLVVHGGHGEFSRVVIAPGDALETQEAVNQLFYLSQKFRVPAIILGDKHLAESKITFSSFKPKMLEIKKSITKLEKFNSYEHDSFGLATESAEITRENVKSRMRKEQEIKKEASKFEMFKIYGNKESKNLIISHGSTKGAILDALEDEKIDAKFIQVIYLEPFPEKIKEELENAESVIAVENNWKASLSGLVSQKTGFIIKDSNKILRYDGRPFLSDELARELKERLL